MTEISILIPCLNEEKTIKECVLEAKSACKLLKKTHEVIVIDNNSKDNSAKLAKEAGAKVIFEMKKGYGNAYLTGIRAAKGKYIFTADGDGTYSFFELIHFYKLCETEKYDFIVGNRFPKMKKKAMPVMHKYIGNPLFTKIINYLTRTHIKDSNSGLRIIRSEKLKKLKLTGEGMEFTSELLIEATRNKLKIKEIPIEYKPRISPSKLRTFRDGLRIMKLLIGYFIKKKRQGKK